MTEESTSYTDIQDLDETPDNTGVNFADVTICIKAECAMRRNGNRLATSQKVLRHQYPDAFENLPEDSFFDTIISRTFPEGVLFKAYFRNMSLSEADAPRLTMRPVLLPGSYLQRALGEKGVTLLFNGHVAGRVFVIDSVSATADGPRLSYESECGIRRFDNDQKVVYNRLYDLGNQSESLLSFTKDHLQEWRNYLDWKRAVIKSRLFGCKYIRLEQDPGKQDQLLFTLAVESEDAFTKLRKSLRDELSIYPDSCSEDRWHFKAVEADKKNRDATKGIQLGRRARVYPGNYLDESVTAGKHGEYRELLAAFRGHPYLVQVAYRLSDEVQDKLDNLDSQSEREMFIEDFIADCPQQGFLATTAYGEFALIDRLKKGFDQLQKGEQNYAPNLPLWLFDIRNARVPAEGKALPEFTDCLNKDILHNEAQRIAVQKMLAAPDVCLIQGPPGTGKTTVIAEAIYQFVKQGQRVLLASQSNDAVDNALDRLYSSPSIRAIRFGIRNRQKRNDASASRYSVDNALSCYYASLARSVQESTLSRWKDLDAVVREADKDEQDLHDYEQDAGRLYAALTRDNEERVRCKQELEECHRRLESSRQARDLQRSAKANLPILAEYMESNGGNRFAFDPSYLAEASHILAGMLATAGSQGVSLLPDGQAVTADSAQYQLQYCRDSAENLARLHDRLAKADKDDGKNSLELADLTRQQEKLKEEIGKAADDPDRFEELRKAFVELKHKITTVMQGSGTVPELTSFERSMLSDELCNLIEQGSYEEAAGRIMLVLDGYRAAVRAILQAVKEAVENQDLPDMPALKEQYDVLKGRYKQLGEDVAKLQKAIKVNRQVKEGLAAKYGCAGAEDEDAIQQAIAAKRGQAAHELAAEHDLRSLWQDSLEKYVARLTDKDDIDYDAERFRKRYIKTCNVVGISCTAGDRELQDNGFDSFDVVIIDEVSKATPPELLLPLMRGRKAVLVGDHRQLPPMFNEGGKSYDELLKQNENAAEPNELITRDNLNMFEKMVTASLFKSYFEQADDSIKHSLEVQYRMHSDIMSVINRFYEHRLTSGLTSGQEAEAKAHRLTIPGEDGGSFIVPRQHAYWVDSSYLRGHVMCDSQREGSTSRRNVLEVAIIDELLIKIAEAYTALGYGGKKKVSVGVISFYMSQVGELRHHVKELRKRPEFSALAIDVNTVDRFQGQEKNIIITSLVRNNKRGRASDYVTAFERINVAFSRAQNLLIIVGARNTFAKLDVTLPNMKSTGSTTVPVYRNIIDDLDRQAAFYGAEKVIPKDKEAAIMAAYEKERVSYADR